MTKVTLWRIWPYVIHVYLRELFLQVHVTHAIPVTYVHTPHATPPQVTEPVVGDSSVERLTNVWLEEDLVEYGGWVMMGADEIEQVHATCVMHGACALYVACVLHACCMRRMCCYTLHTSRTLRSKRHVILATSECA